MFDGAEWLCLNFHFLRGQFYDLAIARALTCKVMPVSRPVSIKFVSFQTPMSWPSLARREGLKLGVILCRKEVTAGPIRTILNCRLFRRSFLTADKRLGLIPATKQFLSHG
jgi:hypothetical protein